MDTIREQEKTIPVVHSTDVLVVGGGTAGVVAALGAARNGATTSIVEQMGFLGGSATGGLVEPLMPNYTDDKDLSAGIGREIMERLVAAGGCFPDADSDRKDRFIPEALKFVLDDVVCEAGVQVFFHTFACSVVMDGDRLQGVIIENKSGRQAILARVVIDCTGDADVARLAGVPCVAGASDTGHNQRMSLRFLAGNVDLERLGAYLDTLGDPRTHGLPNLHMITRRAEGLHTELERLMERAVQDGVLQERDVEYLNAHNLPGWPNTLSFNSPEINELVQATRAEDLTQAQFLGRRAIRRLVAFCQRYLPGCEHMVVLQVAPMVGVRDSFRIVGEYVLTADDVVQARKFPDAIAMNRYYMDVHGQEWEFVKQGQTGRGFKLPPNTYHEVPYRCLVPLEVDNLLVAGRCISADFLSQGSIRVQPNCHVFGQAAGTAAALCVRQGTNPRRLDPSLVRARMVRQGASLNLSAKEELLDEG